MSRRLDAAAHQRLTRVLVDLAAAGRAVPCFGSALPVSEDEDERVRAMQELCPACPAAAECLAAGRCERFGVWGGVDFTPPPTRPRRAR